MRRIVLGHFRQVTARYQPDMWPGDEVWLQNGTLLGIVDALGEFVPNPGAGWN